jgi:hypothetical protein
MMPGYRPGERRRPGETVPPSASPARTNAPGPGGGTTAAPGASPQATPPTARQPVGQGPLEAPNPRTGRVEPTAGPPQPLAYSADQRTAALTPEGHTAPGQRSQIMGDIVLPRGRGQPSGNPTQPNVDRSSFNREIAADRPSYPGASSLMEQAAWMVNGEVGSKAPVAAQRVQLETAFNRAQYRNQSLGHALLSVGQSRHGYYARQTYKPSARPSPQQLMRFKTQVWDPVVGGSNLSDVGWGPMTGNASAGVAANQFRRGTLGYKMRGGDTYFRELVRPGQGLPMRQPQTPIPWPIQDAQG